MERRLIGIATGEIKRSLAAEERVTSAGPHRQNNSRSWDEGNTAFIILSKTKPNTKLYKQISRREASRLFSFLIKKCSIHMSSATNSHNYLNESWTRKIPVLISVYGPVFWPAWVLCWNLWDYDCTFHVVTSLPHNFVVHVEVSLKCAVRVQTKHRPFPARQMQLLGWWHRFWLQSTFVGVMWLGITRNICLLCFCQSWQLSPKVRSSWLCTSLPFVTLG